MPSLAPIFRKANWSLFIGASIYGLALVALTNPWLQRHVLYAHALYPSLFHHDLNKPEQFGFAKNQVTPFNITTPDNETIYAYHVLPLGLYAKHETELLGDPSGCAADITQMKAFKLLRDDPNSRLIINFHGNAGTVVQAFRTDSYRSMSGGSSSNIHTLAIDYRGFGLSSGFPTEAGILIDGIATVDWALKVAKIPSDRIVILGQSLGTAVVSAVAEHFAKQGIDFAGIVLVAGFTTIPSLLPQYSIGGFLPILAPFKGSRWFADLLDVYVVDKWESIKRLANLVQVGKKVRLFIIAAKNDADIPWTESDGLFAAAANATTNGGMSLELFTKMKNRTTVDNGDGAFTSTWKSGDTIIREDIVLYGQHSRIVAYSTVALVALKAFGLDEGGSLPN